MSLYEGNEMKPDNFFFFFFALFFFYFVDLTSLKESDHEEFGWSENSVTALETDVHVYFFCSPLPYIIILHSYRLHCLRQPHWVEMQEMRYSLGEGKT